MENLKFVTFCILLSVLFSCNENKYKNNSRYTQEQINALQLDSTKVLPIITDSIIDIDLNSYLKRGNFDFGGIIQDVKLIPLESNSESFVGQIIKVIVTSTHIFIMDRIGEYSIVIFNRDGQFVKRIPKGRGPGELSRLFDIAYDSENDILIAYQHSFLLFFSSSGDYLRQTQLPFGFLNFTIVPNGYVFKALDNQGNQHLGKLESYSMFVSDHDFKLKSVGIYSRPRGKVMTHSDYLNNNMESVIITHSYNDTIYQYASDVEQLSAKYVLNYGKKKLPKGFLNFDTFHEFNKAIKSNDYFFHLGKYFETETHNVFFLHNYNLGFDLIVYRDKQTGNLVGGTDAGYDVNEMPPCAFPISVSENWLVSIVYSGPDGMSYPNSVLLSDKDKEAISKVTESDNPVLVLFRLKEF